MQTKVLVRSTWTKLVECTNLDIKDQLEFAMTVNENDC